MKDSVGFQSIKKVQRFWFISPSQTVKSKSEGIFSATKGEDEDEEGMGYRNIFYLFFYQPERTRLIRNAQKRIFEFGTCEEG